MEIRNGQRATLRIQRPRNATKTQNTRWFSSNWATKFLLLLIPLLTAITLPAQDSEGIHQGMVRVQGTLAMGIDIRPFTKEQRYYLYGEGEYLMSDHIGVNGSVWANLASSEPRLQTFGGPTEDAYVHSVLAGPVFHAFANRPLDLYLGIQPGFSLVQQNFIGIADGVDKDFQFAPSTSVHAGVAYYGSFFHLFAQARYFRSQYNSIRWQQPMNDLRLCIGLGFNFN